MRAAINPPINTVGEPIAIMSGGPTQVAMSVARAAGNIPISTVGSPGGRIGPPTWGTMPVTIGHTCMSVMRAAGGILFSYPNSWNALPSSATCGLSALFGDLGCSGDFGLSGLSGLVGLGPLPEPAAPPLLIRTIVP